MNEKKTNPFIIKMLENTTSHYKICVSELVRYLIHLFFYITNLYMLYDHSSLLNLLPQGIHLSGCQLPNISYTLFIPISFWWRNLHPLKPRRQPQRENTTLWGHLRDFTLGVLPHKKFSRHKSLRARSITFCYHPWNPSDFVLSPIIHQSSI